ncbi:MAG: DNA recombination protein RmuC, partial [Actinomycetota bacterium]
VLTQTSEEARKQAEERLAAQTASLEQQTKSLMQPFEQQMTKLHEEVTKLREQNADKFTSVDTAVAGLVRQTQALNSVLSSAQGRGNWGERMLEDILSQSGFQRGINYEKQETLTEGGRPDYSFFLPPDRVLYLDSKFPIDNYLKYFEATDENSRVAYRNLFLKNVEDRVKELEKRDYVAQSNRSALEYVLLFIPNEGVLSFIQQHKPTLVDDAQSKKVVLCSPLTLYTFLGVVRQATDSFHMEQNAKEILGLLTKFSKAWAQYVKYLSEIHRHFDQMQKKLKAVTTGRVMSNLRKPITEVEALAKARQVESGDETLREITAAFDQVESDLEATDDED